MKVLSKWIDPGNLGDPGDGLYYFVIVNWLVGNGCWRPAIACEILQARSLRALVVLGGSLLTFRETLQEVYKIQMESMSYIYIK